MVVMKKASRAFLGSFAFGWPEKAGLNPQLAAGRGWWIEKGE
jgi:hypothetical protein